jgi:hypothetical protein
LRESENREQRKMIVTKREEVTDGRRKMLTEFW